MRTEKQPLPVEGYTGQSIENIAFANELKYAEERYMRLLDKLVNTGIVKGEERPMVVHAFDQRMLALARTKMQEANMWAVRSIFQPTRINLPEDEA